MKCSITSFLLVVPLIFTTSPAFAQACIGAPIAPGRAAVVAEAGFSEGTSNLGGGLRANPVGPIGFGADYLRTESRHGSQTQHNFSAELALELADDEGAHSLCAVTGLGYLPEPASGSGISQHAWRMPLGIGIGKVLESSGSYALAPYIIPQVRVTWRSASGDVGGLDPQEVGYGAEAGLMAVKGVLYGGGSLVAITDEGLVLELLFGIIF